MHARIIGVATLCLTGCHGYTGDYAAPPAPLLERTIVGRPLGARDTLLYEAQAVTNVFLFDNLVERQHHLRIDGLPLKQRAQRAIVSPLFRIRQLSDSSAAVRTPSFNPSLKFEYHWIAADTVTRIPSNSSKRDISVLHDRGFRGEWTHHSNGQAGCFRSGFVPDSTGNPDNCTPGPRADVTGVGLNRANGDFSTTYWGLTGFWQRVAVDQKRQVERWSWGAGLGYQLHRYGMFGDMRPEQRALYGTHRGRVDAYARYAWQHVEARIDGLYERAKRTDPRIVPWRGHIDLSIRSPHTLGGGLLVRFLDGQDYYNIGFAQRRSRVLVGIVVDPSRLSSPR